MFIDQVQAAAIENNGGTFRKNDSGFDSWEQVEDSDDMGGYWVSTPKGIENLPKLRLETMLDFAESRSNIKAGVTFLGVWNEEFKSSDTENWSIDESIWVETREQAIKLGLANNQKAIFDVYNNSVITL